MRSTTYLAAAFFLATVAKTGYAQYATTPVVPMQVPAPQQYSSPPVIPMQNSAPSQIQQSGQQTQQLGQTLSDLGSARANSSRGNSGAGTTGDPLGKGYAFLRVCALSGIRPRTDEEYKKAMVIEAACNMYVLGVISGINLYSSLSAGDIAAAKKRGEAGFSVYGMNTADQLSKSAESFNLVCVPDQVTIGALRELVAKHISAHPDHSIWSTSKLTYDALIEAFPCPMPQPVQR